MFTQGDKAGIKNSNTGQNRVPDRGETEKSVADGQRAVSDLEDDDDVDAETTMANERQEERRPF